MIAAIAPGFAGVAGPNAVWPPGAYFAWDGARGVMVDSPEGFLNAPAVGRSKDEREPGMRGISLDEARGIEEKSTG